MDMFWFGTACKETLWFSVFITSICTDSAPWGRMVVEFSATCSWRPESEIGELMVIDPSVVGEEPVEVDKLSVVGSVTESSPFRLVYSMIMVSVAATSTAVRTIARTFLEDPLVAVNGAEPQDFFVPSSD